jgi:1-acyl-sn-glycerol-3-phosphate acyltransferase
LFKTLLFYFIFFISLVAISIAIIISSFFISVQDLQKISRFWVLNILRLLKTLCDISWTVEGLHHLQDKPFVMISNHQGPWESLFLQTLILPTSSVIKKEILYIPFFGWAISRLGPISINRKKKYTSLKRVVAVGAERIREGYVVLLFPEGTRRAPEQGVGRFMNSGGVLAANESVPVIPICHNSGKYWRNHSLAKKSGNISIIIGPPIRGSDSKEITQQAQKWVAETYNKIN